VPVRILVVDDRHSLAWYAQRVLQQEGFEVTTAFDGPGALQKARTIRPDLIVLDTVMPRMDGLEVYRRLGHGSGMVSTPFLFLTVDEEKDRKRLEIVRRPRPRLGRGEREPNAPEPIFDFLTKPFSAEALVARVRDLLECARLSAERKLAVSRPRVLVIDDALSLLRVAERTLEREGYEVVTACDGLEGLSKVREQKPDLILLDIVMPGLDGVQLLRLVRQSSRTPVIMLTSDREADTVKTALDLGADGYVVKPVSTSELVARVKEALGAAAEDSEYLHVSSCTEPQ